MRKSPKGRVKHIGFEAAAEHAAAGAGVSLERGKAIIAAGARKASTGAKKANPRLKKVHGA